MKNRQTIKNNFETKNKNAVHICSCGKKYKSRSGLWKHSYICKNKKNTEHDDKLLTKIYKSIDDKNVELINIIDNKVLNTKPIKQEVNINIFLNEKCKHAMNIADFIENLRLTMEHLNYTKENGYVIGISNILTKNLNSLAPTERPIHCIDKLQFYIKSEDTWLKDGGEIFDKQIAQIKNKQIKMVKEWEEQYPEWHKDEIKQKEYLKIINATNNSDNTKKDLYEIKKKISKTIKI